MHSSHSPHDPAHFPARTEDLLYSDYRKTEGLGTLRQAARALAAETNSQSVLRTLCELSMVRGQASGAAVAELSGDNGVYVACAGRANDLLSMTFALEGTVTGRVANELRAITILSPDASSPFFAELLPRLGIGPILLLPLLANGQLFGVLSISRDTGHPQFDDADEERLGVMADLAALAL